jgi:O-acetyl-ADP-ribose deacetylase (regulator of RNase III)
MEQMEGGIISNRNVALRGLFGGFLMVNQFWGRLSQLCLFSLLIGAVSLNAHDVETELVLKNTGVADTRGIKGDVKIIIKKGDFPHNAADIIVNDAKPSLLGFMDNNASPIDCAVFQAAGGGMQEAKGSLVFDPEVVMPPALKQQALTMFSQNQLVFNHQLDRFQVVTGVDSQSKKNIETYIANGALVYKKGPVVSVSPQNNKLKAKIEALKAAKTLPTVGTVGKAYVTESLNIDKAQCIIHAVVPSGTLANRDELMRSVIKDTLDQAVAFSKKGQRVESIAFPVLAQHYGFPIAQSAPVIIRALAGRVQFINHFSIAEIRIVVGTDAEFNMYRNAIIDYAQSQHYRQANNNALVVNDYKVELDEQQLDEIVVERTQFTQPNPAAVYKRTLIASSQNTPHSNVQDGHVRFASKDVVIPMSVQKPHSAEYGVVHQKPAGTNDDTVTLKVSVTPQYAGFWDTMGQMGWNTSLFDAPGIISSAFKNGWNGGAKKPEIKVEEVTPSTAQKAQEVKKSEPSQSWTSWFNRNFNAICLTTVATYLGIKCLS